MASHWTKPAPTGYTDSMDSNPARPLDTISEPSRVAVDDEGIGPDELGLAARNHGMPLEAMRWDVTPVGMHYLLTHYDIPAVDDTSWRLDVSGLVDVGLSLTLDELRDRQSVTHTVTMPSRLVVRKMEKARP